MGVSTRGRDTHMLAIMRPDLCASSARRFIWSGGESTLTSSLMRISMASKPAFLARVKHSASGVFGGKITEQMLFVNCEPAARAGAAALAARNSLRFIGDMPTDYNAGRGAARISSLVL